MSIVLTSPAAGGSPTAGVGVVGVKVSPSGAATAGQFMTRRQFAPLSATGQPVTLDFSEQMGLAVRVTSPPNHKRFAPITAVALKQNAGAVTVMSAPVSPVKSPVISPIKAGQSVLTKRPSPIFTIASPPPKTTAKAATPPTDLPTTPSTPDGSPNRLRDLLMAQLDLIQRQSEAIVSKDRQLQQLRRENKQLQQRLHEFNEEVRVEVTPPKRKTSDKAVGPDTPRQQGRKRVHSFSTKGEEEGEQSTEEDEELEEEVPVVETPETYFTFQGEAFCDAERRHIRTILSQSEVPRWRETSVAPLSPLRGSSRLTDEDMGEETLAKRHDKPEALEKRRKRWDLQVLRQQRQVERLRAAQEGGGEADPTPCTSSESANPSHVRTFFPDPVNATHIHVGDSLPVSAFGFPLPQLDEEFSLPFPVNKRKAATASTALTATSSRKSLLKQ